VRNNELIGLEWFHIPDLTKVVDHAFQIAERYGVGQPGADQISFDASGFGWGAYDYARRIGWNVRAEDFGSSAHKDEEWYDRRTEMWVGVRNWLRDVGSLRNARPDWIRFLEADLCGCSIDPGKIKGGKTLAKLEAKDSMKKRLGHSPDHGDALALALGPLTKPGRLYTPRDLMPVGGLAGAARSSRMQEDGYRDDKKNLKARTQRRGIYD